MPWLAVAAGIGLYAAQRLIDHLPPNVDVVGLIVSALGILAARADKKHAEVRGDLQQFAEVCERLGGLKGQVIANQARCDQVAARVEELVTVADDHADHIERLLVVAHIDNRDVARPAVAG